MIDDRSKYAIIINMGGCDHIEMLESRLIKGKVDSWGTSKALSIINILQKRKTSQFKNMFLKTHNSTKFLE